MSYTSQCPQLVVCEHLMNIHGSLQSKEIAFPEYTTMEEESQEAEESKCGIKISADNPASEWSTGMIIQRWLQIQSQEVSCFISWCQSINTSIYFHGPFCSSHELAGPGVNPQWMSEILWQQLALSFAVSKMELPFFFLFPKGDLCISFQVPDLLQN